jgi:hypothetical protein
MTEDRQWLRKCSLILADASGEGVDLSELRLTFKVVKGELQTPNTAVIKVYNPTPETTEKAQKEFSRVLLQAGYESNFGLIFSGSVIQFRSWGENNTDRVFEIWASDGDAAYNYSVVNESLPAGGGVKELIMAAARSMKEKGVSGESLQDALPDLAENFLPRGQALYGPSKKILRRAAGDAGFAWSIQDGELRIVENAGYLPGEAVELNAATGLLGGPEQTNEGIRVKCLLNPRLRIGGRVKLNNGEINMARQDVFMGDLALPGLDRDGLYRVLKMELAGDTRGADWSMNLNCVGLDDIMNTPLDGV